jgi:hypothetical protein
MLMMLLDKILDLNPSAIQTNKVTKVADPGQENLSLLQECLALADITLQLNSH